MIRDAVLQSNSTSYRQHLERVSQTLKSYHSLHCMRTMPNHLMNLYQNISSMACPTLMDTKQLQNWNKMQLRCKSGISTRQSIVLPKCRSKAVLRDQMIRYVMMYFLSQMVLRQKMYGTQFSCLGHAPSKLLIVYALTTTDQSRKCTICSC